MMKDRDWMKTGWAWGIASLYISTSRGLACGSWGRSFLSPVLISAYDMKFPKPTEMSCYTLCFAFICVLGSKRLAYASVCKGFVKRKLVGIVPVKTKWSNKVLCRRAGQGLEWGFWPRGQLTFSPDLSSMNISRRIPNTVAGMVSQR